MRVLLLGASPVCGEAQTLHAADQQAQFQSEWQHLPEGGVTTWDVSAFLDWLSDSEEGLVLLTT